MPLDRFLCPNDPKCPNLRFNARTFHVAAVIFCLVFAGLIASGSRPAAAAESGDVYLYVHGCPNSVSELADEQSLFAQCNEEPYYVNFSMVTEGHEWAHENTSDGLPWTWKDVPGHVFTMQGDLIAYLGKPIVYCQATGGPSVQLHVKVNAQGAFVHPQFTGDEMICEWFAFGGRANDVGSVAIDAFSCPAGIDATNADANELLSDCPTKENGVTFTVASSAHGGQNKTTGDAGDGSAYWQSVVPDFIQITESPLPGMGTPRVFCMSEMAGAGMIEFPAFGGTFPYNLRAGEDLTCRWYDIPAATATVFINNHLCPSGPDLTTADMNTLAQSCNLPMSGVDFYLHSDATDQSATTGADGASSVTWEQVAPSSKTSIHEAVIPGYQTPRVFCSSQLPGDGGAPNTEEMTVAYSAITTNLEPGAALVCDWFNLNDGGIAQAGTIIIHPFACPAGFDVANAQLQGTGSTCQEPQDGTRFELVTVDDTLKQTATDGAATFYGINAGDNLTLVGHPLDGYSTGAVYCGQALKADGKVGGYDRVDTFATDTIYPAVVPGAQAICLWFTTPTGDGLTVVNLGDATPTASDDGNQTVTDESDGASDDAETNTDIDAADETDAAAGVGGLVIVNRVCPVDFDLSQGDLESSCWDDANGFGFALNDQRGESAQTTGDWADQEAIWDGIAAQDVVVREDIPDGFTTPIVFCGDGQQMDVSGDGAIWVSIHADETLTCTWFNVRA